MVLRMKIIRHLCRHGQHFLQYILCDSDEVAAFIGPQYADRHGRIFLRRFRNEYVVIISHYLYERQQYNIASIQTFYLFIAIFRI